jgi:hypothetical protein
VIFEMKFRCPLAIAALLCSAASAPAQPREAAPPPIEEFIESTLHHLLTDLYRKLGVSDRVTLVVYAFQHHLATVA